MLQPEYPERLGIEKEIRGIYRSARERGREKQNRFYGVTGAGGNWNRRTRQGKGRRNRTE